MADDKASRKSASPEEASISEKDAAENNAEGSQEGIENSVVPANDEAVDGVEESTKGEDLGGEEAGEVVPTTDEMREEAILELEPLELSHHASPDPTVLTVAV
ncbi:hypothetical protein CAPTEDRAFT_206083, partial [Capitella teleta]